MFYIKCVLLNPNAFSLQPQLQPTPWAPVPWPVFLFPRILFFLLEETIRSHWVFLYVTCNIYLEDANIEMEQGPLFEAWWAHRT